MQKCVVASPIVEHSFALVVLLQSDKLPQNLPTPISLPRSPGMPQIELNASGAASGAAVPPPPPHAPSHTTMVISSPLIGAYSRPRIVEGQHKSRVCRPNSPRVTPGYDHRVHLA